MERGREGEHGNGKMMGMGEKMFFVRLLDVSNSGVSDTHKRSTLI
jgi:hypothetical protein